MTTATLNLIRVQKNIRAKVDSIDLPSVNWKAVCLVGFFISLFLLVFYIWQINDLTRGFYLVNSYEKEISQLSEENRNLVISFAESSFLGQALIKIKALNFQRATLVKYIQTIDNSAQLAKANKKI